MSEQPSIEKNVFTTEANQLQRKKNRPQTEGIPCGKTGEKAYDTAYDTKKKGESGGHVLRIICVYEPGGMLGGSVPARRNTAG